MDAKVFLDFSAVVWDEPDFNANQTKYHTLANEFIIFLQAFESCKNLKFVSRTELLRNATAAFPYKLTNNPKLSDFKKRTQLFLSNRYRDFVSCNVSNKTVLCNPDFCCDYFNESLKIEIRYLIAEMHFTEDAHVFCTFRTRWNSHKKGSISASDVSTKHKTIIHEVDKPTVKDFYIDTIRNIFDHNPKHDSNKGVYYVGKEKVNPLKCYDERIADTTIPQALLDDAIPFNNEFYNYDTENQTFVCFKNHQDNKYHGYDEDINNVPQKIREKFHK